MVKQRFPEKRLWIGESAAATINRELIDMEDGQMDYSGGLFEQTGKSAGAYERSSGIQSVQNLEAVINEGLRVALLEETPDQSLEVLLEHLEIGRAHV